MGAVTNVTEIFSGPTSFGAFFVNSERKIFEVGFGLDARENWKTPSVVACSSSDTSPKRNVMIASGNDLTLYLATTDTSFECEESGGNSTLSPESLNVSSRAPTLAPTTSSQPTQSSAPSTTTKSPTLEPTSSIYPPIENVDPAGVRTKSPVTPSQKNLNSNGKRRACAIKSVIVTLCALGLTIRWL